MTTEAYIPEAGISMTETALRHIQKELAKHPESNGIRLFLQTSGCSGYMYETQLASAPEGDDESILIGENVTLYVPRKDLAVLKGTRIDFVTRGLNSMFLFENPNATGECGCGESFSVS
ncbi:MAG: iron-sulfur cluster assembly accessory protein [Hahellaceae bacterium]|nr:iron-sulfur cluster assembly accessory protein [Hahellaceae bacterium]MCP5168689.1 iron-sulfur cluster assembly accessory protein [Hahellaceae bacterium]